MLLIRTKKDKSQIKKVFIREALGEKWMNSPKQPHDSILPYSEGMKMLIAVRYKKNESRKKDNTAPGKVKSRLVIKKAVNNSMEQTIIDVST